MCFDSPSKVISRRTSSDDSGIGCPSTRSFSSEIRPSNLDHFDKFLEFIHGNLPTDFQPSETSYEFSSLFPTPSQIEEWVSKLEDEEFLQQLILFAVRSGPIQLLCALNKMEKLHPGEQLSNNFSTLQTAVLWNNEAALRLFGFDSDSNIAEIFLSSIDPDYAKNLSDFDWFMLAGSEEREKELQKYISGKEKFDLSVLSAIISLSSSKNVEKAFWSGFSAQVLRKNQLVLADLLICCFGVDANGPINLDGWTPLHFCAAREDFEGIRMLLRRGANPNLESFSGELPEEVAPKIGADQVRELIRFSRYQRLSYLQILLSTDQCPADLHPHDLVVPDSSGQPLMFFVAKECSPQTIDEVLRIQNCPLNLQDPTTGHSLLSYAIVHRNDPAIISTLLQHAISPKLRDLKGLTALDHAVDSDEPDTVQLLLFDKRCWTGLSAAMKRAKSGQIVQMLQTAFQHRQMDIVKPALFNGAKGDLSALYGLETGDVVNVLNDEGDTPAHVAAKSGQLEALEIIVELNGDFWSKHSVTYNTPLHIAAQNGFDKIIRFLIHAAKKRNKPMGLDELNGEGKTPVHLAAENGKTAALAALLELGASSTGYFRNGVLLNSTLESCQAVLDLHRLARQTAIFRAIEKGDLRTLKQLWRPKFDHYFRDHSGDTPIMVAAQSGHLKIVDFLLESCEQEYRPSSVRINMQHDRHVDALLSPKKSKPAIATRATLEDQEESEHRKEPVEADHEIHDSIWNDRYRTQTSLQWIFGGQEGVQSDSVPTLFLDESRVNHVSATNLNDGCCAAHRVIEVGDNVDVLKRLVAKDPDCVNIPEHNAFTALHLAVILRRRSITKYLCKLENTDFYATDLLGRLPEELVDNEATLSLLQLSRTRRPSWWSTMCDETIPLSTAEGLNEWTQRFSSIGKSNGNSLMGSSADMSLFAGKTSASQDGLFEYFESRAASRARTSKGSSRLFRVEKSSVYKGASNG